MDQRPARNSWFRDRRPERWGLGDAIRRRRDELGLSRRALAEEAGLSYPYVSELETGRKRGSPDSIRALAAALGMGQDELWARADAIAAEAPEPSLAAPPPQAAAATPAPASEPPAADLAQRVADALAGAPPAEAEAALLMALGELRFRQAGPARRPDGRFEP